MARVPVRAWGNGPALVAVSWLAGPQRAWRPKAWYLVSVLFFLSVGLMFMFPLHEVPLGHHGGARIPFVRQLATVAPALGERP